MLDYFLNIAIFFNHLLMMTSTLLGILTLYALTHSNMNTTFLSSQQVVYEIITYFPVKIKHTVCFNFISNTYFYLFFLLCSILPKVSIAAFFNDLPGIKRVICCFCDFNDNLSPTMKCNILHQLETYLLLYTNTCFSVLERLNNNLLTILSPSIGQRMMKLRKNTGYIINQVFPNMGSLFDEYFLETLKLYSL